MYNYKSKLVDSSRMIADILVADIAGDQDRFDEMFEISLQNSYPLSMRAARIVEICVSKHRKFILPHLNKLPDYIKASDVDGVKRSFLKILSETPLLQEEDYLGRLTDLTFSYVENNNEAIAIRAFSIDILLKISKTFPDLKSELIPLLENMAEGSSRGLESKCKKILKKITLKR